MASLVIVISAVWVLSCGQTERRTHTDADERFTPGTLVSVSIDVNDSNEGLR